MLRTSINIKPIRNDDYLRTAFKRLEKVSQAKEGTTAANEMEILVTLIEAYEQKYFPISTTDSLEVTKFRMEQQLCA